MEVGGTPDFECTDQRFEGYALFAMNAVGHECGSHAAGGG